MSILVDHLEGPDDGLVIVHTRPSSNALGLSGFEQMWLELEADVAVAAVGVVADEEHFSASAELDADLASDVTIGPRSLGFSKPFGLGLQGDVFDFGLHLVADADIIVATRDILLADLSVAHGHMAVHATALQGVVPRGEANRMGLLGIRGAIPAQRAEELGLIQVFVSEGELRSTLTRELRALIEVPRHR